jgi:hypothetical protein
MLVYSAADFEDFRQPRPDMPPQMEGELEEVVRVLVQNRWPWRLHATYDETISRALDVFEKVHRDTPINGLNWFFDHAETISDKSIDRIAALGGGIAVQHRMAYQGEYFIERYGARPPRPRRPSRRFWKKASRCRPAPTPRAWPPTTLGVAVVDGHRQDRGRHADVPAAQSARPRNRPAHVDRKRGLVQQRGRPAGRIQWASSPT